MPKEKILVVEDEQDIHELITYNLKKEGYQISGAMTGEDALKAMPETKPELVVLDLQLPGLDGLDVCKEIKQRYPGTSILIVTAKDGEADVVTGLELGADDYMTKPFSPRILKARVKAVLRRGKSKETRDDEILYLDDIVIHPGKREVKVNGLPSSLTNMEFKILHFLASRRGWAFTRAQIVTAIRGEDFAVTDRSVDTLIVGLRKKLGDYSHYIETVRSVGYRFKE
jgi:two-component system phosphate regulon response regulator PhoB